jgi:hypothetical protein
MLQVVNFTVAAKQLGIHRRSLERLIEEGAGPQVIQLTTRRRGITQDALESWVKGREMRLVTRHTRKPKVARGNPSTMNEANGGSGCSPGGAS